MFRVRGDIDVQGFALLKKLEPEFSMNDILNMLGHALALGKSGTFHEIRPQRREDAPLNTYSGNYGLGRFPLHTDLAHWHMPPRYLLLRCIQGFDEVPTILVDGRPIIADIGESELSRAIMQPRRPLHGSFPLLRMLQDVLHGVQLLRWDEKFIRPTSDTAQTVASDFQKRLVSASQLNIGLSRQGDTLIIDNWRMLHGRGSVPEACVARAIARAYLRSVNA